MNEKLVKKFYSLNKKIYKDAVRPLPSHGPDHHMRVWRNAKKLADRNSVDEEVLIAACFLHDIAAYYPNEVKKNSQQEDAKRAKKILRQVRFPKDKIAKVVEAIECHGSDPKNKQKRKSMEAIILADADKLEAFGPLGVARIIMVKTLRGSDLEEITRDFYFEKHLEKKWTALTLKQSKKLGRADYEYSKKFFKDLAKILDKNS
jgi:uncharacterized protein